MWISGPGIPATAAASLGRAIDVAPTILNLLGVPVPETMDGMPLVAT